MHYVLGNQYEFKVKKNITPEDVLENVTTKNRIHCASICNQRNDCVGFGIGQKTCFLLKSLENKIACEKIGCSESVEVDVYAVSFFDIFL